MPGEEFPPRTSHGKNQAVADVVEENQSLAREDNAPVGVKNIEAISQTWTKWSLISAYVG